MRACERIETCLYQYDLVRSYLPNDPRNWIPSPCLNCKTGISRKMAAWVPERDAPPGPKPATVCRQGHSRAEHGRLQTKGRDAGVWSCRECERIKYAKRLEREKYVCKDCGKIVSIGAVQCKKCRAKDKKAAQPVYCIVEGCRAKARRREMCATHYWRDRGAAKVQQRIERHREADARYKAKRKAA